ncbi:hypothetical protein niasHT_024589 [Heterodera trifolii]|uniref:Uncharacterized protein n=1 Tax=Heterodera trifolii TaxID=157864 RepID=A0ABD2K7F5_9BILA
MGEAQRCKGLSTIGTIQTMPPPVPTTSTTVTSRRRPTATPAKEYRMRNFTSASAIDTQAIGGRADASLSSSTLGFGPTPPFVPVSALDCNNGTTQQQQNR